MGYNEEVVLDFFALMPNAYIKHKQNASAAVAEVRMKLVKIYSKDTVPAASTLEKKHREWLMQQTAPVGPHVITPAPITPALPRVVVTDFAAKQEALRAALRTLDKDKFYPSLSEVKPLALIISNYDFYGNEVDRPLNYRKGAEKKNYNWKVFLECIGYEVIFRQNLTAEEMKRELEEFYSNPKHKNSCRAIISISSHGLNGICQGVDWGSVFINDIRCAFGAVADLKKKLKLLFLSSCRDPTDKVNPVPVPPACKISDARNHYDVYTLYSTVEHHSSQRGFSVGGMVMWKLLEECKLNAYSTDFEEIVRTVKKFYVDKCVPVWNSELKVHENEVVCAETGSTIIKKFFLPIIPM